MESNNSIKIVLIFIIGLLSSLIYYVLLSRSETPYMSQGAFLVFCNMFMFICLMVIANKQSFYVFEPIVFVFFLYYMIFVFEPIRNILINNVTEFGVNTMAGCIKATSIFMISFVLMLIGYYWGEEAKDKNEGNKIIEADDSDYDTHSLLVYSRIVWAIGVGAFLLYNVMIGRSAIYMLSFGFLGSGSVETTGYSVLVLTVIIYISFYPLMNILVYQKSILLRLAALVITAAPLATRGFRNVLVVVLFAPVLFNYIRQKKVPSLTASVALVGLFILLFGFIGAARKTVRIGEALDVSTYRYSDGLDGILYYFDSYKVFYGAVIQYPKNYSYTYGIQLLYTVIMFIPRFIWKNKPDTPIREVIGRSVGPLSASSGSAWPNIGEYYTDLGILGAFICMLVLGILLRKMKRLYDGENANSASLMLYCLFYPALVTIIAYGYTAGNSPQYLLMALPLFGRKLFCRAKH